MKFKIVHTFRGIDLAAYEELYFNEEFNESLCKTVDLQRELVKRDVTDGKLTREVKVGPKRELPKAAQKIIGSEKIEYTEKIDYTMGSNKGNWETISAIRPDKIETKGTFQFDAVDGGVRRTVEGEIKVKLMGVGGMIERFIVADVEKSYDDAAEFTQNWINNH